MAIKKKITNNKHDIILNSNISDNLFKYTGQSDNILIFNGGRSSKKKKAEIKAAAQKRKEGKAKRDEINKKEGLRKQAKIQQDKINKEEGLAKQAVVAKKKEDEEAKKKEEDSKKKGKDLDDDDSYGNELYSNLDINKKKEKDDGSDTDVKKDDGSDTDVKKDGDKKDNDSGDENKGTATGEKNNNAGTGSGTGPGTDSGASSGASSGANSGASEGPGSGVGAGAGAGAGADMGSGEGVGEGEGAGEGTGEGSGEGAGEGSGEGSGEGNKENIKENSKEYERLKKESREKLMAAELVADYPDVLQILPLTIQPKIKSVDFNLHIRELLDLLDKTIANRAGAEKVRTLKQQIANQKYISKQDNLKETSQVISDRVSGMGGHVVDIIKDVALRVAGMFTQVFIAGIAFVGKYISALIKSTPSIIKIFVDMLKFLITAFIKLIEIFILPIIALILVLFIIFLVLERSNIWSFSDWIKKIKIGGSDKSGSADRRSYDSDQMPFPEMPSPAIELDSGEVQDTFDESSIENNPYKYIKSSLNEQLTNINNMVPTRRMKSYIKMGGDFLKRATGQSSPLYLPARPNYTCKDTDRNCNRIDNISYINYKLINDYFPDGSKYKGDEGSDNAALLAISLIKPKNIIWKYPNYDYDSEDKLPEQIKKYKNKADFNNDEEPYSINDTKKIVFPWQENNREWKISCGNAYFDINNMKTNMFIDDANKCIISDIQNNKYIENNK